MIVRLIGGLDIDAVLEQARRSLADKTVQSVVIHNPGSRLSLPDGREMVVLSNGELLEQGRGLVQ
jgi:hypothetical protein